MIRVNPDSFLWTENPMDFALKHTSSALVMYCNDNDLEPIRVALPSARMLSYVHPGVVEAAMNGYASGHTKACRRQRFHLHWSCEKDIPDTFPTDGGPDTRWHDLRSTFREAFNRGEPHDYDPVAADDPNWFGRLWMHDDYWVMIGAHEDASPLGGPTRIELPELPANITTAYEFDGFTLAFGPVPVTREGGKVYVTINNAFSAVLLPKPSCPPLVLIEADKGFLPVGKTPDGSNVDQYALPRGQSAHIKLKPFAPWRTDGGRLPNVDVKVFGLEQSAGSVALPGEFTITAPADAAPGNYIVKATGECLELKRWIRVK